MRNLINVHFTKTLISPFRFYCKGKVACNATKSQTKDSLVK